MTDSSRPGHAGPLALVCPLDWSGLERTGQELRCAEGHAYPIRGGAPVLLVPGDAPTHAVCAKSVAEDGANAAAVDGDEVDPYVQEAIAATCGNLYRHLQCRLSSYPIPEIRLPPGEGRTLLVVGCHWGRWCVAATRRGYRAVGIDPSLEGITAARRVALQLGADAAYVVGDERRLPFEDDSIDVAFSYSVFQHFTKEAALASFDELGRVLKPGGTAMVQLANVWASGVSRTSCASVASASRARSSTCATGGRTSSATSLRGASVRPSCSRTASSRSIRSRAISTSSRAATVRSSGCRRRSERRAIRVPPLVRAADSLYAVAHR